jgi:hypothetical protein
MNARTPKYLIAILVTSLFGSLNAGYAQSTNDGIPAAGVRRAERGSTSTNAPQTTPSASSSPGEKRKADLVDRAISEQKRFTETQKSVVDNNNYQNEENNFFLTGGKMYSQLITFRYVASQRDPFVSANVISPYVTVEEVTEKQEDKNPERIKQAIQRVEAILSRKIKVSGISYGKTGLSYALANETRLTGEKQVIRPGGYLLIETSPEETRLLDEAAQAAKGAGGTPNLEHSKQVNGVLIKVTRVDDRSVGFQNPIDGAGSSFFDVIYTPELGIRSIDVPEEKPQEPEPEKKTATKGIKIDK